MRLGLFVMFKMATSLSLRLYQYILNKGYSHFLPRQIGCTSLSLFSNRSNLSINHYLPKSFPLKCHVANLKTNSITNNILPLQQEVVEDTDAQDKLITEETIALVNDQISKGDEGRLFAIVHIQGKQFKITQEDVIVLEGYWAPQIGDKIQLEKVLLLGSSDFTLIGRPILPPNLVSITATIIDKDLSHIRTKFFKKRRKQYKRINFIRSQLSMLRINEIKMVGKVNERKDVEGLDQIFH